MKQIILFPKFYASLLIIAFIRAREIEVSDSKLTNEMRCFIKLCYHWGKIVLETVKLMIESSNKIFLASL